MPVQVSYPGVYIQEVASGVHTITGVSTSIARILRPDRQRSNQQSGALSGLADFIREFGGAHPLSDLAASVRQFFDNGGTDCYVVRLAKGAAAATVTLNEPRQRRRIKERFDSHGEGAWHLGARRQTGHRLQHAEPGRHVQSGGDSRSGRRHCHAGKLQQSLDEPLLAAIRTDFCVAVLEADRPQPRPADDHRRHEPNRLRGLYQ